MRLLEYEAKALLAKYGLSIPKGWVHTGVKAPLHATYPLVLKAQVPVGGRGKLGGVRIVTQPDRYEVAARTILGKTYKGYTAIQLLAEEKLDIVTEMYLAVVLDRTEQGMVLLAQKSGGMEVEAAHDVLRAPLKNAPDMQIARQLTSYFDLPSAEKVLTLLTSVWALCLAEDAVLVEVNPLAYTTQGTLVCADAKIELDSAAAFRHKEWHYSQTAASSQFVILNKKGNVACMANGAGLAMATVDAIMAAGGVPANFLDVGGGTNTDGMVRACRDIAALPDIRAIVVNIFAGITRCDQVAEAIIAARKTLPHLPPIFIRLSGTNEAEGKKLLHGAGIATLASLKECVAAAVKEARHV